MIQHYSINIPFFDEFDVLLNFYEILKTEQWEETISLIFKQHNEHQPAFNQIVYLIFYYFFKEVKFGLFSLIGNYSLIIPAIIFYASIRKYKLNWRPSRRF